MYDYQIFDRLPENHNPENSSYWSDEVYLDDLILMKRIGKDPLIVQVSTERIVLPTERKAIESDGDEEESDYRSYRFWFQRESETVTLKYNSSENEITTDRYSNFDGTVVSILDYELYEQALQWFQKMKEGLPTINELDIALKKIKEEDRLRRLRPKTEWSEKELYQELSSINDADIEAFFQGNQQIYESLYEDRRDHPNEKVFQFNFLIKEKNLGVKLTEEEKSDGSYLYFIWNVIMINQEGTIHVCHADQNKEKSEFYYGELKKEDIDSDRLKNIDLSELQKINETSPKEQLVNMLEYLSLVRETLEPNESIIASADEK